MLRKLQTLCASPSVRLMGVSVRSCSSSSIWTFGTPDNDLVFAPMSKMENFTKTYLSHGPCDHYNRSTRISILKDEVFGGFHAVRTPEMLKSMLLNTSNSILFAMQLRDDLLLIKRNPKDVSVVPDILRKLDAVLVQFLESVFCRNLLSLQRITFEHSSGIVLEKLAEAEAVHKIRALSEMKHRLSFAGRRCFALFHPCLENVPLTFVHISLCDKISTSMRDIYNSEETNHPTCAIYYSINSPYAALGGLSLAESLLKRTVMELNRVQPSITTHSTLSPIPGFMKWLSGLHSIPSCEFVTSNDTQGNQTHEHGLKGMSSPPNLLENLRAALLTWPQHGDISSTTTEKEVLSMLCSILNTEGWHSHVQFRDAIKQPVMWLCHFYLLEAKEVSRQGQSMPLDPVSRFHLRNGAILHQVNWLANTDPAGMKTSAGMMVNYRYDMVRFEQLKQEFASSPVTIPRGEPVLEFVNNKV